MIWTVNLHLSRSWVEISPRILILGVTLQAFAVDLIFPCKICMENSPLRIFIGITFYFEFSSSCCLLFWRNESFHIAVVCLLRWLISLKCFYNFVQFRLNSRRRWKTSRIATQPAVLLIQNHVCYIFLWRFCCSNTQPNWRFLIAGLTLWRHYSQFKTKALW